MPLVGLLGSVFNLSSTTMRSLVLVMMLPSIMIAALLSHTDYFLIKMNMIIHSLSSLRSCSLRKLLNLGLLHELFLYDLILKVLSSLIVLCIFFRLEMLKFLLH
jgi:hypothetical protein